MKSMTKTNISDMRYITIMIMRVTLDFSQLKLYFFACFNYTTAFRTTKAYETKCICIPNSKKSNIILQLPLYASNLTLDAIFFDHLIFLRQLKISGQSC